MGSGKAKSPAGKRGAARCLQLSDQPDRMRVNCGPFTSASGIHEVGLFFYLQRGETAWGGNLASAEAADGQGGGFASGLHQPWGGMRLFRELHANRA